MRNKNKPLPVVEDYCFYERVIHDGKEWIAFTEEQFAEFHDLRPDRDGGWIGEIWVKQYGPYADCDYEVVTGEVDLSEIADHTTEKKWAEFLAYLKQEKAALATA